jgi:CheY-like chemotaxis protein
VLDLTRAEFGHLEVELAEVDPLPVTEEVAALLEGQAQQKGLVLELDAPDGAVPPVRADRRRLRQILLNLVANAVKFTDAGAVTLRVRSAGGAGHVAFEVTDTGIGIEPLQQPHVFDEFFQADRKLTRRHGGAGLGLAISRRLARLMGGDLTVASELGHGSLFTLGLPVAPAETPAGTPIAAPADTAGTPTAAPADTAGVADAASRARAASTGDPNALAPDTPAAAADAEVGPATVVVFGPDETTVAYLARALYPDVRLVRASGPLAVAALARRERASLIVLDVSVDGGAGWQVAHALHSDAELEEVPLLILPAAGGRAPRTVAPALDLGVVAFAAKLGSVASSVVAASARDATSPPGGADAGPADAGVEDAARLARAVGRAATAAPARGTAAGSAIDVLVVDDDPDARRVTADVLRAAQAMVREAPDGEAALAAMRLHRPDVAVVDLMMPVLDGFGVLAAMRADARLRGVPVVVLTTKALTPDERAYLARTAERVIEKASTG